MSLNLKEEILARGHEVNSLYSKEISYTATFGHEFRTRVVIEDAAAEINIWFFKQETYH